MLLGFYNSRLTINYNYCNITVEFGQGVQLNQAYETHLFQPSTTSIMENQRFSHLNQHT